MTRIISSSITVGLLIAWGVYGQDWAGSLFLLLQMTVFALASFAVTVAFFATLVGKEIPPTKTQKVTPFIVGWSVAKAIAVAVIGAPFIAMLVLVNLVLLWLFSALIGIAREKAT